MKFNYTRMQGDNMQRIKSEQFELQIKINVCEADISLPVNTILNVGVRSCDFSANISMDVDIRRVISFAKGLLQLYTTLSGIVRLEETYGMHNFIEFSAEKGGHIKIKGQFKALCDGFSHELAFENEIDQTYLHGFAESILNDSTTYFA